VSAGSVFVLTATLGFFFGYLGLRKIGIRGAGVPLVIFSIGSVAAWFLFQNWFSWLELFDKSETLSGRTFLWSYAVQNIAERPFLGFGYTAFWKASSINVLISNEITWQAPHAHNGYLDLALDLGLLLAGLYLGALIWILFTSLLRPPSAEVVLKIILSGFLLSANLLERTSVLYHDIHYMLFLLLLFISHNASNDFELSFNLKSRRRMSHE
jgi:O-antigen ligase